VGGHHGLDGLAGVFVAALLVHTLSLLSTGFNCVTGNFLVGLTGVRALQKCKKS
jgi:hypothetical protein